MKLFFNKIKSVIKAVWDYFWKLNFFRDLLFLQWGSFWDLGLSLMASVVYAHLLGVGTYGDYALIFALAALIGLFMDWGTGYATLTLLAEAYTRKNRSEIKDIITYFLKLNLIITVTFGLVAIIFTPTLAGWFYHNPLIGQLARLVIIGSIFKIFFSLLINLLQVMRKIKYLTIIENVNKFFAVVLPVILVLMGFGLAGIVYGYLLTIIGSMVFSILVYRNFSRRNPLVPSFSEIIDNFFKVKIKKYFKFGFILAIDKNLSNLFGILPLIVLGYLAASTDVANLKIALAYLALPNGFLNPISRLLQVQLPKAKVAGIKDLKVNFYKSSFYAGTIFIFLTLGFLFFAPFLIKLVYGKSFAASAQLVYPLSLSVIFSGFAIGFGSIYRTINKNIFAIAINSASILSGFIVLFFALKSLSPLNSVVLLIVYWSLFNLISHLLYIRGYFLKLSSQKI
ncbi:MAG: oligosaccharide flippase family protein [Patescibacteria group bacterium]|jgi:O-antigen/teichoic acid export membrane protein